MLTGDMMTTRPLIIPPDPDDLWGIIAVALAEDIGKGDITSLLTVPQETQAEMHFTAREQMVACGIFLPAMVYGHLSSIVTAQAPIKEGQAVKKGTVLAIAKGPAQEVLMGERVAL